MKNGESNEMTHAIFRTLNCHIKLIVAIEMNKLESILHATYVM